MSSLIRLATLEDAKAISTLAITTFHMACPASTPAEDIKSYIENNLQVECFENLLQSSQKKLHVLEFEGRIIGYSMLSLAPEPVGIPKADGIAELTRCYVLAEFHGAGYAQKLVSATLQSISGGVRLLVNDENDRAIKFYTRQGFSPVGETSFYVGQDKHRDLVMVNF
ncbi:GNAT family N-acetyltransferase [Rouxiella silvae]|uniref:GNAT family N-acetyltransferase n=1 Tax=Rouxiella silvae TaxID=1646373 RepID=A0AA41BYK2_9GAMM|nr:MULTISPECIES: GNAT family N-acetyltransferase [Rouxiella]KAB7897515.1 GNAT family N-acetyltransferase [Rouxiella sp. S1S-2]KQN42889.1 GNAT family acetyltransferase [Serratia sp. Leaf50]MBF6639240.1 GNAT family N-acetyltransferase [Rouxiella silvae]ORJ23034.1 GNAT family N-acetyltransferase [Rouxiella silvae]